MEATQETVEVPEVVKSEAPIAPSIEDLKAGGWSAKEIDSAEKRGMVAKPEQKKEAPKAEADVSAEPKEEKNSAAEKTAQIVNEKRNDPFAGTRHFADIELTPEQEKVFLSAFPSMANGKLHPVKALYLERKGERLARQRILAEKQALEAQIEILKAQPKAIAKEVDENGNEIDPEDRPLTLKQLREMQQKQIEDQIRMEEEAQAVNARQSEAIRTQEEYAKSFYADYADVVKRAVDVVSGVKNGTLDINEAIPEKWKQHKVGNLLEALKKAKENADKFDLDGYHAGFIAYEIGQLLSPTNGQRADADGKPKDPNKANGGLTPEQMKRIEENTQRRASSASIPGGNSKRMSADDVTLADLNRMETKARLNFREKFPEQYARLIRG